MRDTLKPADYFDGFIAKDLERRDKFISRAENADTPERRFQFLRRAHRMQNGIAIAEYSRGGAIETVKAQVDQSIELFFSAMQAAQNCREYVLKEYAGGYDETFSMLGLAVLFKMDIETGSKLARSIDFFGVQDALWETMLTSIGVSGRKEVTSTVWPDAYQSLLVAQTAATGVEAQAAFEAFFKSWYSAMDDTAWYDNHRSSAATYYGYWCFEGAAIARIKGLDVSAVRNSQYFPADLFDATA